MTTRTYRVLHEAVVPGVATLPLLGSFVVEASSAAEALRRFAETYYLTTDTERLRAVAATAGVREAA